MQNSLVQHDLRTSSLEELVHPAQSRRRCGRGGPSPGADVGGVDPVLVQMWAGWAQSRCRCGRGEPSPGADVGGVDPVPAQMWHGSEECARSLALPRGVPPPALPHTVRMRGTCGGIGGRAFCGKGYG